MPMDLASTIEGIQMKYLLLGAGVLVGAMLTVLGFKYLSYRKQVKMIEEDTYYPLGKEPKNWVLGLGFAITGAGTGKVLQTKISGSELGYGVVVASCGIGLLAYHGVQRWRFAKIKAKVGGETGDKISRSQQAKKKLGLGSSSKTDEDDEEVVTELSEEDIEKMEAQKRDSKDTEPTRTEKERTQTEKYTQEGGENQKPSQSGSRSQDTSGLSSIKAESDTENNDPTSSTQRKTGFTTRSKNDSSSNPNKETESVTEASFDTDSDDIGDPEGKPNESDEIEKLKHEQSSENTLKIG